MVCEVATGDSLGEADGDALADGDSLADGDAPAVVEGLAEADAEGLAEAEADALPDADADALADEDGEALSDPDADALAEADGLADADALGLGLGLSKPMIIWPAASPTTCTVLTDPIAVTALSRIWRGSERAAGDEHALTIAAATRQAALASASRFGAAAN